MIVVAAPHQAIENIYTYHKSLKLFADLMPRARSWYAIRTRHGWKMAPSKVIGYQDLDPKAYISRDMDSNPLDGRVTESILQDWAELIEEGDPLYDELHACLSQMCAALGKKPNRLARISILEKRTDSLPSEGSKLVELLATVYSSLSPAQKAVFRKLVSK